MVERPRGRRAGAAGRGVVVGAALIGVLALLGAAAPWLAPYDPTEQPDAVAGRYRPPLTTLTAVRLDHDVWILADRAELTAEGVRIERLGRVEVLPAERVRNLGPAGVSDRRFYLLGSDKFGRDVLSRWLYGARVSLLIGALALAVALLLGVAVGALAALGGRLLDSLLMRTVDGLLSFPWMFLIIALTALFPTGTGTLILLLGATGWMGVARLARAELLSLRELDFVQAARGLGAGPVDVFFRHLLPNAMTPLLVDATLRIGNILLIEAALSFLGFGVQPPQPSWGNMIAEGEGALLTAWWIGLFPGLALVLTVGSLSLISDGLRDLLDPRRS